MNRMALLGIFAILAAAQIAVPASMIVRRETILQQGTLYKFRVAPVDPYDAFRGRYVALGLDEDSGPSAPGAEWVKGQTAYAQLAVDSEGFAHFALVTPMPPDTPEYLVVTVAYAGDGRVYVHAPIDRYYMAEDLAPQAELAYREHARAGVADAYIAVRIRDGMPVIDRLYVAGVPIEDYLRSQM